MLTMQFRRDRGMIDLQATAAGLEQPASLYDRLTSAVVVSLFSDRRAAVDDPLPDPAADRRGWVGDALSPGATGAGGAYLSAARLGSRLWLLKREKQTEATRRRAEDYAREALAWLVEDGHATAIDVTAAWVRRGVLALQVELTLSTTERYVQTLEVTL